MKNLRGRFERFCYRNQNKGIRDLMLYIAIGTAIVYVLMMIDPSMAVYRFLRFDREQILHGQIWRLVTYVFIPNERLLWLVVMLVFNCYAGRMLEQQRGVCWLNLYFFTGVLLTDVAAMLLDASASIYYLDMSLFLAYATVFAETQVRLNFLIPLKAKYLAWFYFLITIWEIIRTVFPYNLFPLIALLNYFLFFGARVLEVLPDFIRPNRKWKAKRFGKLWEKKQKPNPNWANGYRSKSGEQPYRHKCTVCGRTDAENPGLEFRYCSKCNGYYCYCIDHINNHAHIQ